MKKLYRDRWDKKIAGVCGGLGRYLGVDPTMLRLVTILLAVFSAFLPLLVCYIIAWLIMPLGPSSYVQFDCKRLYRSQKNRKIAGICGGIAELWHLDPTIVRLLLLFLFVITGVFPVLITYLIGIVIIPEKRN